MGKIAKYQSCLFNIINLHFFDLLINFEQVLIKFKAFMGVWPTARDRDASKEVGPARGDGWHSVVLSTGMPEGCHEVR